MALLDIIITHYNEPWSDGRKMFEMLKLQRGVDWKDVRVILVQDGDDEHLDLERIMKVYPFVGTILHLPKGGVSIARNEGLECADAEWVMFCDFDDTFYSVDSLYRVLQSIREAGDRADMIWSDIWIEMVTPEGKWIKRNKGWNTVFIHGKVYRRSFLMDHGIRYDPELCYSEDAMFNALVAMEIDQKRVGKMPETVYMWCFRPGSASNYKGGDARRNLSLYKKRVKLSEEYEKRGRTYDAKAAAVRTLLDYYWELNGQDECAGHTKEEWVQLLQRDVMARWPRAVMDISMADRAELFRVTKEEATAKQLVRDGMPGPEEWLYSIGAIK
jgi:glycosyltransferase involved in cell wall biosynthesis